MTRLLDWQVWMPRLMFVAVVLLAVQYVLGLATRSQVVESGESAVGARVGVAHARVSVGGRQVLLQHVRMADPRRPLVNLIEADRCEFNLATAPLFKKRVVVESGRISGLRFETPREVSGVLGDAQPVHIAKAVQWLNDQTHHTTEEWLEHLNRRFDPRLIEQFEALQRTAALRERVPAEMAALEKRIEE